MAAQELLSFATPPPAPVAAPLRELLRTGWLRALLVVEVLTALAVGSGLWALRQQTIDGELRSLAALSAAMAAQADGTLDVANAALRATRQELADGLMQPTTAAAHALLRARADALPKFHALTVFDAQGLRVATSRDDTASRPVSVAKLDFFLAARGATTASLFVGSPYASRTDGGQDIGVSIDWRDASGTFRGVIAIVADAEFLDGDFARIAPAKDAALAIYRRDRALVSDGPGNGSTRLLPARAMDALWADAAPERPRLVALPGGARRLVAAHRLQNYQLMVVVTRDADAVLVEWSGLAWVVSAFAASGLVVTLWLGVRNAREQSLREASEAARAAGQARALRAFQAARDGHWEWNPVTRTCHFSPRMRRLLGLGDGDALPAGGVGVLASMALHPDDIAPLREAFWAHHGGRAPSFDFTFRVGRPNGRWRHVRARGRAWRDDAGTVQLFSGTAVDVTDEVEGRAERLQLEEQLQRARKFEALGTLAGGVAHDFNNILASVIGYGELARDGVAGNAAAARQLDQVLKAGQRGKALVERILSFSHGVARPHLPFRLQPVVEEVLQWLEASLPAGVTLMRRLHAPDAVVRGDATAFHEAAMNLCTNGIHAMRSGGQLAVTLEHATVAHERAAFIGHLTPATYIRLRVEDQGEGIAAEAMPRLFEPFFTTKAAAGAGAGPRGTGLGLAVVHGIVLDLAGAIDVHSEAGRGARFDLYLPEADDVAPEETGDPDAGATPMGHGESVLVVDDEPALVELAEELLAGLGYEPFGLTSSDEALRRFRDEPDRFALLLTDEIMPGLTGTALATAVHALRPGLPVVLVSGWGGGDFEQRAAAAGVSVHLAKPLTRAELAQALARALHR